jgi:hypothetical protein
MKSKISLLLIGFILSTSLYGNVSKTTKSLKRGKENYSCEILHCKMLTRSFNISTLTSESGKVNIGLSGGGGRWQRFIFFLKPNCTTGKPENTFTVENEDGSVMAQTAIPIKKDGANVGSLTCQAMQLPKLSKWVFFHFKNSSLDIGLATMYLGVTLRPQPLTKVPRVLFLAWPEGKVAIGGNIPWLKTKNTLNALAWFSRGGNEDMMAEFIVFNPNQLKPLMPVRWRKGDDRASFCFAPIGSEMAFAMRADSDETTSGENVAVPNFLKKESQNIYETMMRLNWKITLNWDATAKELNKLEKTIKQSSDVKLKKKFDSIKSAFSEARKLNDVNEFNKLKSQLKALKEQADQAAFNSLF